MIGKGAVPGNAPAKLAHLGCANGRHPPPDSGPPRNIDAMIGATATAWCVPRGSRTGNADPTSVRIVQNATPSSSSSSVGNEEGDEVSRIAIAGLGGTNTSVAAISASAPTATTPARYSLRDFGILRPVRSAFPMTVAPEWRNGHGLSVLKASERSSSSECDHRDACERHRDAHEVGFHGSGNYQPFADSGATLVPPLRPSRPWGNTKTDLTLGRSVALIALPHPKCPFQVWLLRVRAYLPCFLVLGY